MIEFNIADAADQKFSTIISNRRVTFRLRFNHTSERWSFDMAIDGDYVLTGRRIVPSVDLISPYSFDIGVIFAYSPAGADATKEALVNGTVKLYQASQEEKENALA